MSYQIRYTKAAKEDIVRLYGFLVEQNIAAARKALDAIEKGIDFLQDFLSLVGRRLLMTRCFVK